MVNFRVLFKSIRFAFRAKKRVLIWVLIYSALLLIVGNQLQLAGGDLVAASTWILVALLLSTLYAILIAQFRRRDISILKCVSWGNSEILLLLIGEVILVSLAAFFLVMQVSIELLGFVYYFEALFDVSFVTWLQGFITIEAGPLFTSMVLILLLQLPGLALALARAIRIPPMQALREE